MKPILPSDLAAALPSGPEIEVITKLRGRLAEQLVKLSEEIGAPPVEVLADLIEQGLDDEAKRKAAAVRVSAQRETDTLLIDLRRRAIAADALAAFKSEAQRRGRPVLALAEDILRTVAADNLFAAVLDTGDDR